jgi:hypothetical protein
LKLHSFTLSLAAEHPVMEFFTAITHRVVHPNVWAGDQSIE